MGDAHEPVVVVGLGRFGAAIALELSRQGTEVLAIDSSRDVVQAVSRELSHVVTADCTDLETLRQLGVGDYRRAVVAIGDHLEDSILVTSLLVDLEVPDIWARAISAHHGRILERIGAHHVVFPEQDMGQRVAHLVSGTALDYLRLDDGCALAKLRPPRGLIDVPLGSSEIKDRYDVTVVSIKRRDEEFISATSDTVVRKGDIVLVVGRDEDVERLLEDS
ncbi:TrkA family potassium uptake protein [Actinomycetospora corticicola]|uniref:Trk system potassium uptake protein TrkA n=1 Tax=Actinomycetospora corticicola TaxID=663602 RepID=A0A7Y9DT54_9PSEU|nr:TrkA family potassium uptake protein [Actinomycetospora corticicola]NYD34954.1 trk system potassium uptake protein TrkA [Actinomycetospora corticicola]